MQPSTIEKALHQWPLWKASILKARSEFNFTPLPAGEQLRKWQWDNGDAVWNFGEIEMKHLGLPQSARYYWLACFYSNYLKADGNIDYDAIKDIMFAPSGEFGEKAYPTLYEYSVTIGASTRQELLSTKIIPVRDAISSLLACPH